jgi:hypothetical protein
MLLHSSLGDLDVSGRKFLRVFLEGVKKNEGSPRGPEVQQAVTLPPVLSPQLSDFSLDLTRIGKGQGRSLLGEERDDGHDLCSARLVEAIEEILYRALPSSSSKNSTDQDAFTVSSIS